MSLQPIILYNRGPSPNPWKVAILLEELGLPWKFEPIGDVKSPEYVKLNPNGRVPTLTDPNKNITIWETGAIYDYLVAEYDTTHKFQPTTLPEKYHVRSWAFFQVSGQGPYFGQKSWFSKFHHEQLPSAIDRYAKEVRRIIKVVDDWLAEKKTDYLVGDKVTYADFMWQPYFWCLRDFIDDGIDVASEYPHVNAWLERLYARPATGAVKKQWEGVAEAALKGPPPKH